VSNHGRPIPDGLNRKKLFSSPISADDNPAERGWALAFYASSIAIAHTDQVDVTFGGIEVYWNVSQVKWMVDPAASWKIPFVYGIGKSGKKFA